MIVHGREMIGEPGPLVLGGVRRGAVGSAEAEEHRPARLELDWHRQVLVGGMAAGVVIAFGIAAMRHQGLKGARDHADGTVGHGGVVDRDPHGGPDHGICEVEVGVVLVPVGGRADPPRFEKDLVKHLVGWIAHELRHRFAHARVEDEGGEEAVVIRQRADLQVLPVPLAGLARGGDVGEHAALLELGQAAAQGRHLGRAEEVGHRHVALAAEVRNLLLRKHYPWAPCPCPVSAAC